MHAFDHAGEMQERRQELVDHIDEGTRQLRLGEGIEIHGDEELRTFFDRIQAEGMRRRQENTQGRQRTERCRPND